MGISKIDTLNYKNNPYGIKGHFIEAAMKTASYRAVDRGKMTIEEYRDYALRDNGLDRGPIIYNNDIEVTYFSTVDANNFNNYIKTKKLIEEEANYTVNYILGLTVNGLLEKIGAGTIKAMEDFSLEKEELQRNIKIEEVKNTAGILDLEFVISQNHTYPGAGPDFDRKLDIEFYPTAYTFEFLDKWEKAYIKNKDIPYPKDHIQSQNWYEIAEYWLYHSTKITDDLYDYIKRGK